MAFSTAELAELEALLAASDGGPQLVAQYRERFPGKSITRCDASDLGGEEPYKRFPGLELFFLDSRDHCAHITKDPADATGVVLAKTRSPS